MDTHDRSARKARLTLVGLAVLAAAGLTMRRRRGLLPSRKRRFGEGRGSLHSHREARPVRDRVQ